MAREPKAARSRLRERRQRWQDGIDASGESRMLAVLVGDEGEIPHPVQNLFRLAAGIGDNRVGAGACDIASDRLAAKRRGKRDRQFRDKSPSPSRKYATNLGLVRDLISKLRRPA